MPYPGEVRDETRPVLLALLSTVVLHSVLGVWLSSPFADHVIVPIRSTRVLVAPTPVDQRKLPQSMQLAQVSHEGNRETPQDSPFLAAKNQKAAQPIPEPLPTRSALPKSEGVSVEDIRLTQALPKPSEPFTAQLPQPEAGTPNIAMKPGVGQSVPLPRPQVKTPSTPKASLPSGTYGLLLRNPVGVNRAGTVSLDARFSSYGDYAQRMMEAIQASWWSLLERAKFDDFAAGIVIVRFTVHRDGTATDAEILTSTVPELAALSCKDSVLMPAPYDTWRADMVAMLGEDETVTITFHYR